MIYYKQVQVTINNLGLEKLLSIWEYNIMVYLTQS